MIGWFPTPYPDELLYSICARYSEAVQYPNKQSINADLLGKASASSMIDMPLHLEHLASVLPHNQIYSVDSLVRHHTLFPFYAPFIALERVKQIKETMRSGARKRVHSMAGVNRGPIRRPNWLRFCPACIEQDRKQYGETYWRRIHQLSGVEVCLDHLTFLESSPVSIRNPKYTALYLPAEQNIKAMTVNVRPLDREDKGHQTLVRLASDATWLLNQNLDPDPELLRANYHTLLMDRGLISRSGTVKIQKLMDTFRDVYPRTLLVALQCDFDEKNNASWLAAMFSHKNRRRTHHPILHLLLIQFLGYTAESFFAHRWKWQATTPAIHAGPFGAGPYFCLNPACQYFRQPVIREIIIKRNVETAYLPTGFFTCSCGFSYARRGPDRSVDDQLRYDWVRSYGAVWVASLKEIWADQRISIAEMTRRLRCGHQTIINKAISLGLSYPRCTRGEKLICGRPTRWKKPVKAQMLSGPAELQEEKLRSTELYREQLLSAMRQQPGATRTMLRKTVNRAYEWLWEYDRNWLTQQLPPPRKSSGPAYKADWASRDERLSQDVRRAAADLKSSQERPVRVVKNGIARYLGEHYLLSDSACLAKLPLTLTALNEVVETRTDFMLRRIRWAEEWLREEGGVLNFSRFAGCAGIKFHLWQVPEVKAAIESALISLQSTAHCGGRSGSREA